MKKTLRIPFFVFILTCITGCSTCKNIAGGANDIKITNLIAENDSLKKELKECQNHKPKNNSNDIQQLTLLRHENDSLKKELSYYKNLNQKSGKYPREVDEMLNIDNNTIFNERFKQFDIKSIHVRSREMYQWVCNIHELDNLLRQIEDRHHSIEKYNENLENLPSSTIEQLGKLNLDIKNNIAKANQLKTTIENSHKDMEKVFSSQQMDYYNGLVSKLNEYINLYF